MPRTENIDLSYGTKFMMSQWLHVVLIVFILIISMILIDIPIINKWTHIFSCGPIITIWHYVNQMRKEERWVHRFLAPWMSLFSQNKTTILLTTKSSKLHSIHTCQCIYTEIIIQHQTKKPNKRTMLALIWPYNNW